MTFHQSELIITPRFLDDPQEINDMPLCEHNNWTDDPNEEMCGKCGCLDCGKRVESE